VAGIEVICYKAYYWQQQVSYLRLGAGSGDISPYGSWWILFVNILKILKTQILFIGILDFEFWI
jgi:hypothetical protein